MTKTTILFVLLLCISKATLAQQQKLESHLKKYFPILPYNRDIKHIADFFLTNPAYIIDTSKSNWSADSNNLFISAKTNDIHFTNIEADTLRIWLGEYLVQYINTGQPSDTIFKLGVGWYYQPAPNAQEKVINDYKLLTKEFISYFNHTLTQKQKIKKVTHGESTYFYSLPYNRPVLTIAWSDGKKHDQLQIAIIITSQLTY